MANPILRQKLDAGAYFTVPGVQDMIAAVVADKVGFDIVYGSGYWLTASSLGLPDAGIATYTEMADRMRTLVRGIIAMAQDLGLRVVAEGVETQTAMDVLRAANCDEAQGYLIARPLTPDAFERWLASHGSGTSAAA